MVFVISKNSGNSSYVRFVNIVCVQVCETISRFVASTAGCVGGFEICSV